MKGVKGKIVKKLKSIKQIDYLKPERLLQVSALEGFIENFPLKPSFKLQNDHPVFKQQDSEKDHQGRLVKQEIEIIDVVELRTELEDEGFELEDHLDDKENIRPSTSEEDPVASDSIKTTSENSSPSESESQQNQSSNVKLKPLSDIDISSFRRPDMDSGTLFDPNLLAAFQQAVMEHKRMYEAQTKSRNSNRVLQIREESQLGSPKSESSTDPLLDFEQKCPPGGIDCVVLYTTSLRGIRKTFEDCHGIRFLLESFRVIFHERDVSIHSEFREELWNTMGVRLIPPRLFIKGRYIGGAEEVLGLHEQGRLRPLFEGIPIDRSSGPCEGCYGIRFVMCFSCSGSRKIFDDEEGKIRCPECNENGLIVCPFCC